MAATELTAKPNASGASGSAVAGAVARSAALVATSYGQSVQGLAVLGQPAADSLCRLDKNLSLRCPLVAAERCVTDLEGGRGCPRRRGAGQRKVVLAREVRRFATARSWSWHSCTLKAINTRAATPLLATVISPWKRCGTPSSTTPNPSIEGTCNIWLRQLSPAPHVKR